MPNKKSSLRSPGPSILVLEILEQHKYPDMYFNLIKHKLIGKDFYMDNKYDEMDWYELHDALKIYFNEIE